MRVALVTGSSRGIGAQCARALAKEGYAVCINCVERTDKAEALAEELKANGANAIWQQADVGDALAVSHARSTSWGISLCSSITPASQSSSSFRILSLRHGSASLM